MAINKTELLQVQTTATQELQRPENRDKDYGVLEKLHDNRMTLAPALASPKGQAAIDPEDTVVSAQVASFENKGDATGTQRTTSHDGSQLTTTTTELTWEEVTQAFSISEKNSTGNHFSREDQLVQGLLTARQKCLSAINEKAATFLGANRSGVSNLASYPLTNVSFDGVNDITNVANAGKDLFFSLAKKIMNVNLHRNVGIDFVHDSNLGVLALDYFNQGAGNDANKQYQIGLGFNLSEALLATDPGQFGVGYMFPQGSVAMVNAIPQLNRMGKEGADQIWTSYADPIYPGLVWALHIIEKAENGNKPQDLRLSYELSLNYAFGKAPLSTANETVIHKLALLNS